MAEGLRGARARRAAATPPQQTREQSLCAASDRNLADCMRHLMAHSGGVYEERGGVAVFAGAHNFPGAYTNGLLRLDDGADAEQTLATGRAFFAGRRRGYAVWIRPSGDDDLAAAAAAAGYEQRPPPQGNALTVIEQPTGPPRRPERLASIVTAADVEEYLGVMSDAYAIPEAPRELLEAIFFTPSALLAGNVEGVVARVDGRAVAGGTAILAGDVAGVLYVATRPRDRGSGLGSDCMRHVVNWSFAQGARLVCAQSSQMGTPQWVKLGYEVAGYYRRFIAPPVAGA